MSLTKSPPLIETACTRKTQHNWKSKRKKKGNHPPTKKCETDLKEKKKVSSHEAITLIICPPLLCLAEVGLVVFPVEFSGAGWVFFFSFSAFLHNNKQPPREKSYKYLIKRPAFPPRCWNSLQTLFLKKIQKKFHDGLKTYWLHWS